VKIKPLSDRVVIKPIAKEEETKGGIIIPDTAKEKPQEGEVIALGEGKILDNGQKIAMSVKIGDRVIYSKYAGTEIKRDDQEYLIVSEKDILAIIEK